MVDPSFGARRFWRGMRCSWILVACAGVLVDCQSAANHASGGASDAGVVDGTPGPPDLDGARAPGADSASDAPPEGTPFDSGTTGPMVLISRNVPAYGSTEASPASSADDDDEASNWASSAMPAWLAYDLSGVSASERADLVVAWYTFGDAAVAAVDAGTGEFSPPLTYVLEGNAAPGGASQAPTDGWQALTLHDHPALAPDGSITTLYGTSNVGANVHWVAFTGYNWLRMRVLTSALGSSVSLDMDVYSAPSGPTDSWLFMGDSITHICLTRGESGMQTIPLLVKAQHPDHFPAMIEYGIGGTASSDLASELPTVLQWFTGKYITLDYGTNYRPPAEFYSEMEAAVQAILQAGHIPVIPTPPYPNEDDASNAAVQMENEQIPLLEQAYPQIVPGPDLWTLFLMHPEYTTGSAPHPNDTGKAAYIQAWADWMALNVDTQ